MTSSFDPKNCLEELGAFLSERYAHRKQESPGISLRGWAYRLGLKSNAPLSLMMKGKRPVPIRLIPGLSKLMKLNKEQTRKFEHLVLLGHAKTKEFRDYISTQPGSG